MLPENIRKHFNINFSPVDSADSPNQIGVATLLIYEKYHNLTFICIFPGIRRVMNLRHGLQTQLLLLDPGGKGGPEFWSRK